MFHALSKILFFATTPVMWIAACLVLALFWKNKATARKFLIGGVVLFFVFTNAFLQDELIRLWEPEMSRLENDQNFNYAIVLGGYSVHAPKADQLNLYESGDRIWQALELYHTKKINGILLSGGQGQLLGDLEGEAAYTARHIVNMGVKKKDLLVEPNSKNTRENAIETKKILDSLGIKPPYLLITSAMHMPRSQACFTKIGLEVVPYNVDGLVGERKFYFDHMFLPQADTLFRWNIVIHEWVGYFVYKLMGYV
ncbi:MAG: YdcF family protein [Flavobacteriales bacterium]|nr:YdcF family protein [Flavobacteriales bacterium]